MYLPFKGTILDFRFYYEVNLIKIKTKKYYFLGLLKILLDQCSNGLLIHFLLLFLSLFL